MSEPLIVKESFEELQKLLDNSEYLEAAEKLLNNMKEKGDKYIFSSYPGDLRIPIQKIRLERPPIIYDADLGVHKMVEQFAVQTVERIDAEIMKEITKMAAEAGITSMIVLDKEFITTAIINELARRNENG